MPRLQLLQSQSGTWTKVESIASLSASAYPK